jgi:retinol dehydrogenase 12
MLWPGERLFTSLLLDRLRASARARIVNVASGAHHGASGIDFEAVRRPTRTITGMRE